MIGTKGSSAHLVKKLDSQQTNPAIAATKSRILLSAGLSSFAQGKNYFFIAPCPLIQFGASQQNVYGGRKHASHHFADRADFWIRVRWIPRRTWIWLLRRGRRQFDPDHRPDLAAAQSRLSSLGKLASKHRGRPGPLQPNPPLADHLGPRALWNAGGITSANSALSGVIDHRDH